MAKREYLASLFLALIAISLSLVLAVIIGVLKYFPAVHESDFIEVACDGERAFYLPGELFAEEKRTVSSNAKAFSFLVKNNRPMRVISDYTISQDNSGRKLADYSLIIKNISGGQVDLGKSQIKLEFSDGESQVLYQSSLLSLSSVLGFEGQKIVSDATSADLVIGKPEGFCQAKIKNILMILPDSSAETKPTYARIIKGNQSGDYLFAKGYTPIGFSSWRYLKPFVDRGLTVMRYDQISGGWVLNPQNASYFAEPGIAYFVFNPNDYPVKVNSSVPFFVPNKVEDHRVTRGWNLLYNDTGSDTLAVNIELSVNSADIPSRKYYPNKTSLQELIDSGQADSRVYFLPRDFDINKAHFDQVDFKKSGFSQIIPDGSFFWVYLFDDSNNQGLQQVDLTTNLIGGRDTYQKGQYINFELKVKNNNNFAITLPDDSQKDPCLAGLEFYSADGRKISSDFDNRTCPLWPKTLTVEPGDSVSYRFAWKPAKDISGKIEVKSYFDYTRLGGSDILYNRSEVNIK